MSEYKPLTCLPVLPLRGIVVFPGCVTHLTSAGVSPRAPWKKPCVATR